LKKILLILLLFAIGYSSNAQNIGDTIKVKTFHYGSNNRDTFALFPDNNLSYEKIILKYNMRCKNGLVSNSTNRDQGCGEWDYSCNTYIVDSAKVEEALSTQANYIINDFSGNSFKYALKAPYNYYRYKQKNVIIDSTNPETHPPEEKVVKKRGRKPKGGKIITQKLEENNNFEVIREPVDLWLQIKGSDDKNLLQQFYQEPERYAYLFQTMVFKTRLESLDHQQVKPYRFSERSIWTDRHVFGKSCINSKKMNDLETNSYKFWFDWLEKKFFKKPDGIIYLRTTPEKCLERIRERARHEELTVSLEYLKEIHNYHEEWLNEWKQTPILTIDNNNDNDWNNILNQVNNFVDFTPIINNYDETVYFHNMRLNYDIEF
jgi:deoxyadenosine/deoxycytidine kinase